MTGAAGQIGYSLVFRIANGDLLGKSEGFQTGSQDPIEEIFFENGTSGIATVQVRHDPDSPTKSHQKLFLYVGGPTALDPDYQTKSMTLTLPADAKGAVAVGAVAYSTKKLEGFSSQGPTADNRPKPDVTAGLLIIREVTPAAPAGAQVPPR